MQIARRFVVFGDKGGVFTDRVEVALFDGGGDSPVHFGAIRFELRLVGDCANQRVVKHILGLAAEPHLIDELGGHQVINVRLDAQPGDQFSCETHADNCCSAQRTFGPGVEAVDARSDGRLQGGRNSNLSRIVFRHVYARVTAQHATLGKLAHDLLSEIWSASGPLGDRLAQRGH